MASEEWQEKCYGREQGMLLRHVRMHASTAFTLMLASSIVGCSGGSVPRPPRTQVSAADYVAVPFAPRLPRVEVVPPRPNDDAVWVDGSWSWEGSRYRWRRGAWVIPPPGARYARWVVVRRTDGQLFFAPSSWKDEKGNTVPAPPPLPAGEAQDTTRDATIPGGPDDD